MRIRSSASIDDGTPLTVADFTDDDYPDMVAVSVGDFGTGVFTLQGPLAVHRRLAEEYLVAVDRITVERSAAEEQADVNRAGIAGARAALAGA